MFWSYEDPLEEGMAAHSSILSWRIPWTEEPGELQSVGSHGVGHNSSDLAHKVDFKECILIRRILYKVKRTNYQEEIKMYI